MQACAMHACMASNVLLVVQTPQNNYFCHILDQNMDWKIELERQWATFELGLECVVKLGEQPQGFAHLHSEVHLWWTSHSPQDNTLYEAATLIRLQSSPDRTINSL
jgi:hypothetical protein